jgi:membrane-bound metal-dependent hydrolase YbcI (DUF457 family)
MMGRTHAVLGLVGGLGMAEALGMRPGATLAFASLVAGASLLPDLDEPHSAVSHTVEPITTGVSWLVARSSGGHRKASHSLIAGAATIGVVELCSQIEIARHITLLGVVMGFILASLFRVLRGHRLTVAEILAVFGVALAINYFLVPTAVWWPLVAIGLGYGLHLAEDWITMGGVPVLWPWKHRFEFAICGQTDSRREHTMRIVAIGGGFILAITPIIQLWR